jgi:hypothetical protein
MFPRLWRFEMKQAGLAVLCCGYYSRPEIGPVFGAANAPNSRAGGREAGLVQPTPHCPSRDRGRGGRALQHEVPHFPSQAAFVLRKRKNIVLIIPTQRRSCLFQSFPLIAPGYPHHLPYHGSPSSSSSSPILPHGNHRRRIGSRRRFVPQIIVCDNCGDGGGW